MSKISFVTFCIEQYAEYKKTNSHEVFKLFEDNGVINLLIEDYEDLHGQGFEYLMKFIDKFLGGQTQ